MPSHDGGSPKLLFVLSNDFGELSNALYFTLGTEFRATFLLPERLFVANRDSIPHPVLCYRTTHDILAAVERDRPDLVGLFSGYLYAINGLFEPDDLEAMVRALQGRRVRLVVSDPFLGILAQLDDTTFSERHPRKAWLTEHFVRLWRVFAGVPHLYLVPMEGCTRPPCVSFFNSSIVAQRAAIAGRIAQGIPAEPTRPRWMFILSAEDYGGQVGLYGRPQFNGMLCKLLRQSVRAGRQPVLVAPKNCVDAMGTADPPVEGLVALPFCSHATFLACLLEAEYAFYWNVFSNSIPARVMNYLPVFLFDSGHLVRAIPPLSAVGMERYFRNAELPFVDMGAELSAARLAPLAARQAETLEIARENYRRSPSPEQMVECLLAD